jgi:hypothetical protein
MRIKLILIQVGECVLAGLVGSLAGIVAGVTGVWLFFKWLDKERAASKATGRQREKASK